MSDDCSDFSGSGEELDFSVRCVRRHLQLVERWRDWRDENRFGEHDLLPVVL